MKLHLPAGACCSCWAVALQGLEAGRWLTKAPAAASSSQQDCQRFTDKEQKHSAHPIMRSVVVCVLLVGCLWSVQAAQTLEWTSGIATFTGSEVSQL